MEKPTPRRLLEWSLKAQDRRAEWARKIQGWHRTAEEQLAAWHRSAEAELEQSDPAAALIFRTQNQQVERDLINRHRQAEQAPRVAEGSVRFMLVPDDRERIEPAPLTGITPPPSPPLSWSTRGKA